ncbi:MAG: DUF4302 domain-containing protein [Bacteroides sp.]
MKTRQWNPIWMLAILLFAGCSNDYDSLFDLSPDQRGEQALAQYAEVLQNAPNGWLMHYYSSPQEMGGITYVMKFDKSGRVTMNWSIRDDLQTANYSMKMLEKPMLIFDTYSNLSKLCDPDMGLGGENEFAFLGLSADQDTLFMEERVNKDPVVMVKASDTAWEDILRYPAQSDKLMRLEEDVHPFYYNLHVEGWDSPLTMTYYDNRQFVNFIYREEGKNCYQPISMNFTHEGFELSRPFTRNGISVRCFKFDEAKQVHVVTDAGCRGEFVYEATPAAAVDGIADMYFSAGHFGEQSRYCSPKASELFKDIHPEHPFMGISYDPYGGFWSKLAIVFDDYSDIRLDAPEFTVTGENTVRMASNGIYTSWYYSEEEMETIMSRPAAQELLRYLLAPEGWTVIPYYIENEYNRYFYLISNLDPEIYFGFGGQFE